MVCVTRVHPLVKPTQPLGMERLEQFRVLFETAPPGKRSLGFSFFSIVLSNRVPCSVG